MNNKHHCTKCNTYYETSKLLRNHRGYMRNVGQVEGHELKIGQSMATPSLVGEKLDERMKDF